MTFISNFKQDARAVGAAVESVFTGFEGEIEAFFSKGAAAIATTIRAQAPQVGKTALGALVVSAVGGLLAIIVAGLITKMQPVERTVITQHTETYDRRPDAAHNPDPETRQ